MNWLHILRLFPPERAHNFAFSLLQVGWKIQSISSSRKDNPILNVRVWERDFSNPIGLAAGFDKDARAPGALLALGFGFIEVGTVTPKAQLGNRYPRLFRLTKDEAIVNRMGFNNNGLGQITYQLYLYQKSQRREGRNSLVGVSIGCNRNSLDVIRDYVDSIKTLLSLSDYLVINISSPNTPGLKGLHDRESLNILVQHTRSILDQTKNIPLLMKITPDLQFSALADVAAVALSHRVDGLIATNTTSSCIDTLKTNSLTIGLGGLSGKPLLPLSTTVLANLYRLTHGQLPLIGVGGISSGVDALLKIKSGASLVQIYTTMLYNGPSIVQKIKDELIQCLYIEGYRTILEAVGSSFKD